MLALWVFLLVFQIPTFNPASCPYPNWRVSYYGPCKTRKDLDEILAQHKRWIDSNRSDGKRANLQGAILSSVNLSNVDLWGADLSAAILSGAKLTGAVLGPTRHVGQDASAAPGAFVIAAPTFLSAEVVDRNGVVTAGFSYKTNLRHAVAQNVDFSDADLSFAELEFSDLSDSSLFDADLAEADLGHARLIGTKLDHANLRDVDLFEAVLEPSSTNGLIGLESAKHLETVSFETNPSGLIQLRELMRAEGFREQERKLTYALNRNQAERDSFIERWFNRIAFDATCQYGMSPGRCLRLVIVFWALFSAFFYIAIHKSGWMLLRVTRRTGDSEKTRELSMWHSPGSPSSEPGWKKHIPRLKFEWRVIRASTFFSLVNAFSIGYRDFSIGRWLLLLTKREYEIKPTNWARTFAGVQSLLTVYLFALWLLTYFGHPFQ